MKRRRNGRPRTLPLVIFATLATALIVIGFIQLSSRVEWCDISVPRWMLEAQDYKGGGCARELPFWEAPPDADWTMVCLGMCPVLPPEPSR